MRTKDKKAYLEILHHLTPEKKLAKTFELSSLARRLTLQGLRKRFPGMSQEEFTKTSLAHLSKCHNRNY